LLIDGNGELFYNPEVENQLPTIYTFSLDYIKTHRTNLISLLRELKVNEVYIAHEKTIIQTSDGKAVLPPLSKLSPLVFDRLKRVYSIFKEQQVEIFMTSEGVAVVKEEER
jgi:hypothetical protein